MAQSALTVTPPSPTPPTNFPSTGVTGPNPPNYTRQTYSGAFASPVTNPPPFYDDGTAPAEPLAFAANVAALASGTSATDNAAGALGNGTVATAAGGTGVNNALGTYPGTTSGLVPASTSVAHEGAGSEVIVVQTYPSTVFVPGGSTYSAGMVGGPLRTFSDLGNFTSTPNASHASSLSPAVAPALTSITPGSTVSGVGTTTLTATGTGFTKQSVVYVNGVPQTTVFVSSTSLTCAAVTKKATAGPWNVVVVTGGVIQTSAQVWTFT